jgi:predicted transposase YdaD
VSSPHDALFKATFSNLENARSELALVLPSEVVERIDWSSLALEPGEFIDDDLTNLASDLLYTVRLDGVSASVYVLCEHPIFGRPHDAFAALALQYLKALGPHAEEAATTMADELIAEGREKGRAEGRAEAESSMLLRLLTIRHGPLSAETEQLVREATSEERALWAERVLTAASLEELFRS